MELDDLICQEEKSPQELYDYVENKFDTQECSHGELICIKETIYCWKEKIEKSCKKKERLLKSIVTGCKKSLSSMRKLMY